MKSVGMDEGAVTQFISDDSVESNLQQKWCVWGDCEPSWWFYKWLCVCVFVYYLCLEVRRRVVFLFQMFFLISRRMFGLQFIIKWCWRIEIGSGLCLKKRERREKFSVTHLKTLNRSNLLIWNSVLAQFLLLQLCMMASCNKKINVISFSLLCSSILVNVLQMRIACRFWGYLRFCALLEK